MSIHHRLVPLVGAAISLGVLATGQAWAIKPATPANGVVGQLKSARALLEKADHDYKGHRAKAVHEITMAIHVLEGNTGQKHARLTPQQKVGILAARQAKAAGKQEGALRKAMPEAQAVSDTQLKSALDMLTQISSQMGTTQSQVQQHLQNAAAELKTALAIR